MSATGPLCPEPSAAEFSQLFDQLLCTMDYDLGPSAPTKTMPFFGNATQWGIDVVRDEGSGYRQAWRRLQHISADPHDNFLISIPRTARVRLAQSGLNSQYDPGTFSLLSTARPFFAHISADQLEGPIAQTIARISGPLLRNQIPDIDDYCGEALKIRPGAASYMVSLLDLALAEGTHLSEQQSINLCKNLIDAVAEAIIAAPELTTRPRNPAKRAKYRLLEHAESFIHTNLSNPDLNAHSVAEYLNISPRYLRSIFSNTPHTVSSYIRELRLTKCQNALMNPRLRHKPITEIAMTWGFNDAAYFSRSYSAHFGVSPRETRRLHDLSSV